MLFLGAEQCSKSDVISRRSLDTTVCLLVGLLVCLLVSGLCAKGQILIATSARETSPGLFLE